jgi:hypothetical protein
MSVNSQKQTYLQSMEWLKWFNKKYNRVPTKPSPFKSPKKYTK